MATGVQGLDAVLAGGLLARRVYVVRGPPGSGKTVLAAQLCFKRARAGGRCVYLTALAESNARLIENLSSLEFFDPALVAKQVVFVSGAPALDAGGLKEMAKLVRSTVQKLRAELLILDGLAGLCERAKSPLEMRRFMREIATSCSLLGCTAVATMPSGPRFSDCLAHAENIADGVLALSRTSSGMRASRALEVVKMRGSPDLPGKHTFEITSAGVVVHPRTEARLRDIRVGEDRHERRAFGIEELDAMLCGGIVSDSTTILAGGPGAGKTLLGMQFLAEGARRGEPCLYFGFYETPRRLVAKGENVGLRLGSFVQRGTLEMLWQPALEDSIDALAERLLEAVQRRGVQRLFIDGLDGFEIAALVPARLTRFFIALTNELRTLGVTTLMAEESELLGGVIPHEPSMVSAIFENLLLLRYVELRSRLYRLLSVVKLRESDYDRTIRELTITSDGLHLASTFDSAEAILTGHARHVAPVEQARRRRR